MQVLYEDDVIPNVAKHKGKTIKEIASIDPQFLFNYDSNKYAIADIVLSQLTTTSHNSISLKGRTQISR